MLGVGSEALSYFQMLADVCFRPLQTIAAM